MNRIFTMFFIVLATGASVFSNSEIKEPQVLYGVDNVQMPNDSLMLMNSLLVDYQVDYDIALATKNPNEIVSALHKIGLVYLKLEQFDLASNYGWRLLNVAQKHKLKKFELFAYAMLYRVYRDSGNFKQSTEIYNEYQIKLTSVSNLDSFSIQTIQIDNTPIANEAVLDVKIQNKTDSVNLTKLEKHASLFAGSFWYIIGLIGLLGVLLISKFIMPSHNTVNRIIDVTPVSAIKEKRNNVIKEFKGISAKTNIHPHKTEQNLVPTGASTNTVKAQLDVLFLEEESVVPESSNFSKLTKQVEHLFKKQEISYNWSIVGDFKQFSDNSFSSFLYIFETVTKMMLHETCQMVSVNWVEVSKGLVLKIQLRQDHWVWSGASFQMWKKELMESHEIFISLELDSSQQYNIVFKKYY